MSVQARALGVSHDAIVKVVTSSTHMPICAAIRMTGAKSPYSANSHTR